MKSFEASGVILVHLGEASNVESYEASGVILGNHHVESFEACGVILGNHHVESFEACGVILVHLGESSYGVILVKHQMWSHLKPVESS